MKIVFALISVFFVLSIISVSWATSTDDVIEELEENEETEKESVIKPNVQKSSSKGNRRHEEVDAIEL